jgi:hypothetical protein
MALGRLVTTIAAGAVLALVLFGAGWLVGRLGIGAVVSPDSLNTAEREFVERMRDVTSLPGLGTFTVRLFFYNDRYAGSWQHGERGGYMSGRIESRGTPDPKSKE